MPDYVAPQGGHDRSRDTDGLGLGNLDDIDSRLGDLQGRTEADGAFNPQPPGPTPEPLSEEEFELFLARESAQLRVYRHVKDGVERGPYSASELKAMAERGELSSVEEVTHRTQDRSILAARHPYLRPVFLGRIELDRKRQAQVDAVGRKAREDDQHRRGTLVYVLIVLAIFGGAAAFFFLRQGS